MMATIRTAIAILIAITMLVIPVVSTVPMSTNKNVVYAQQAQATPTPSGQTTTDQKLDILISLLQQLLGQGGQNGNPPTATQPPPSPSGQSGSDKVVSLAGSSQRVVKTSSGKYWMPDCQPPDGCRPGVSTFTVDSATTLKFEGVNARLYRQGNNAPVAEFSNGVLLQLSPGTYVVVTDHVDHNGTGKGNNGMALNPPSGEQTTNVRALSLDNQCVDMLGTPQPNLRIVMNFATMARIYQDRIVTRGANGHPEYNCAFRVPFTVEGIFEGMHADLWTYDANNQPQLVIGHSDTKPVRLDPSHYYWVHGEAKVGGFSVETAKLLDQQRQQAVSGGGTGASSSSSSTPTST